MAIRVARWHKVLGSSNYLADDLGTTVSPFPPSIKKKKKNDFFFFFFFFLAELVAHEILGPEIKPLPWQQPRPL